MDDSYFIIYILYQALAKLQSYYEVESSGEQVTTNIHET